MPPRAPKLQRWTDLIAALLRRNYPATFEELSRDVPAYADESKKRDAVMRMFERDKDELRAFGIAIETVPFEDDAGEASGYRLDRKGFYLPYLSLAAREGKGESTPRKPDKYGYRALVSLIIEPDELAVIVEAAARVRALGDPVLAEEAKSAMRKLSFDLPIPGEAHDMALLAPMRALEQPSVRELGYYRPAPSRNVFEILNDALARRKRVRFHYRSMGSDTTSLRQIEPYGLFFLSSHWYLAGRDAEKSELRNFRLSRISDAEINPARSQTADYAIPPGFDLRDHARSRQAWEIGDGAGQDALVEFRDATSAAKAASRLGIAVEGPGDRRRFKFRRIDSFARWLLSFGGEAIPLEPAELVSEFEAQVRATHAVYEEKP